MRIFKRILILLSAAVLLIGGTAVLGYCLIPNDVTRVKVHHTETAHEEILILGTSHGAAAFDPDVIAEETGKSCYNAAAGGLYPIDNYYILQNSLRTGAPETVVLEFDPSYWITEDGGSPNEYAALSAFSFSDVKVRAMISALWKRDFRNAVMPWYMHRSEVTRIRENIAVKRSEAYKTFSTEGFFGDGDGLIFRENGQLAAPGTGQEGEIPFYEEFSGSMVRRNLRWFSKTLALCKEKGIRAVVVLTPVPEETAKASEAFYAQASAQIRETAAEYGAEWIDYVGGEGENPAMPEGAFYDFEGHMHEEGAAFFSRQFADLIY